MSLKDKARLIFAHHNRQCDSKGKEQVLTTEEEDWMIKDCRDKREIDELNRLTDLYNLSSMAMIDVHMRSISLELEMSRINTFVLAMHMQTSSRDHLTGLLYFAKSKKGKVAQAIAKEIKNNIKEVTPEYELFSPSSCDDFKDGSEYLEVREPNLIIQGLFSRTYCAYIGIQQALYAIKYIEEKAGISLLRECDVETLNEARKRIDEFADLKGFVGVLKMYRTFYEANSMRKNDFSHPLFFLMITDFEKALPLTEEKKVEVEEIVDRQCKK